MKCPRCSAMMEPHSVATQDLKEIRTLWLCPSCCHRKFTLAPNYNTPIPVGPKEKRTFHEKGSGGFLDPVNWSQR